MWLVHLRFFQFTYDEKTHTTAINVCPHSGVFQCWVDTEVVEGILRLGKRYQSLVNLEEKERKLSSQRLSDIIFVLETLSVIDKLLPLPVEKKGVADIGGIINNCQ